MNRCLPFAWGLLIAALVGCSTAPGHNQASTIRLTASLISPVDIRLKWKDTASNAAGHTVEWCTESNGEYVVVAFASPGIKSFVHSDVVPQTACYYRVRPYFGPASQPIEITTGKELPNQQINVADDTWFEPKTIRPEIEPIKNSVRNPSAVAMAAPTDLKAELVHPTGIQLTWTDHATDEDGYMLEMKTSSMPDFQVCAIMDPGINSYGYALVPPETKVSFRVRPFYYGQPSNIASRTTGLRPPDRKDANDPSFSLH